MINFRYHIVSLMAVFIALSVGIAVGVSLSPSVDQGIIAQAAQDRKQVTDLRAELDRRNALDEYREAYDLQVGKVVAENVLSGIRVAIVAMPDAPTAVVEAISAASEEAGGNVVRDVKINAEAFDPSQTDKINEALAPWAPDINSDDSMSSATKVGLALGRSITARGVLDRDSQALAIGDTLTSNGWATISKGSVAQAQLVIVVAAEATDPRPTPEVLAAHVQFDVALKSRASVVVAGPNSEDLEGTDVLAIRSDPTAVDLLSTVDVADLNSGVTTSVLAGREQLNGSAGRHYGALAKADAPLPDLPVR